MQIDLTQTKLLELIGRLGVADIHQINDCYFAQGSWKTTHTRHIRPLERDGYLEHTNIWRTDLWTSHQKRAAGSPRYGYKLSTQGYRYLVRTGISRADLILPSDNQGSAHTLQANDLIVFAHRLIRHYPHLHLQFRSEKILRRMKVDGVIPDAWLKIWQSPARNGAFALERDKETIPLTESPYAPSYRSIRHRIEAYLQLMNSPRYSAAFGTVSLLSVWVCNTEKRQNVLAQLAKKLLEETGRRDLNARFYFGLRTDDPDVFFFAKRWLQPGGEVVSLLPERWRD
jgi:hypothetical protein